MKIFLDTGNLKDIEAMVPLGIVDGKSICTLVQGPVSAEVVATQWEAMVAEGRELAAIDDHVVVKVPFTRDGVRATKVLDCGQGMRAASTAVVEACFKHPLTDIGLEKFLKDWEKAQASRP